MDEENSSAIVRPVTNSPLSAESRQAMFSRATISSASFRGNNELISASRRDKEETISAIQTNQQTLSGIQQEIVSLRQEIGGLNPGLLRIASLIERDSLSEQEAIREQQERERRLAEQKIRLGKEDELENKIQNAIVAPVQALTPKVNDLFGSVGGALAALFGGWLVNQTIEYIKAEGKKNTERMVEIKNNIIRNVAIAGGAIIAIRSGFAIFANVLRGVISKIASLLGKIIAAPFKGAAAAANNVANMVRGKPPGGPAPKPGSSTPGAGAPKPGGPLSGAGNFIKGLGMPLLTGTSLTGLDIASGENPARAAAGAAGGMISSSLAFAGGSVLPIPGSGVAAGALAYGPGAEFGKGLYDKAFGSPTSTSSTETAKQDQVPSATITPQSSMVPGTTSPDSKGGTPEIKPQSSDQPKDEYSDPLGLFSKPSQQNQNAAQLEPNKSSEVEISQAGRENAQLEGAPKQIPQVGPAPEPKPTVVMAPSQSAQQPSQSPMNSGPLADVPLIPSANPDNFYVLYSQMHYNVVV